MSIEGLTDTIAAISTPIGESGIGIVRMSGKDSQKIAGKIFISKDSRKPSDFKSHTTHYGWIADGPALKDNNAQRLPCRQAGTTHNACLAGRQAQRNIIDEVILTVMRAPRTYTREDIVEINCHGGITALRWVLGLVLEKGARLAEPGEFTRRAFLNGRIDLAQAEAVLDIIRAKTDSALKMGVEQLRGSLSVKINKVRSSLLSVLSGLEAGIDFPEEGINPADFRKIAKKLNEAVRQLKDILSGAKAGRIMREGITAVICGRPNVGKSSLLNALLKQERSIVTPIAGTTRDTIEEAIDIKGIPVRIIDTAGIIAPQGLIEHKAVRRSKQYMELADLVILLFDGSLRLTKEDRSLISKLKDKAVVAAINKIDLGQKIEKRDIVKKFGYAVEISAKKNKNINLLEEAIAELVYGGKVKSPEPALVSNIRHVVKLREAEKLIADALDSLDNKLPPEFICSGLRDALLCLDDMLGKRFSDDLLDKIFSEFCIGK